MYSLVELMQRVDAAGDGLLEDGQCEGDVRDAVVVLAGKAAKCHGKTPWRHPPAWTLREVWAVDVLLRALLAALRRCEHGGTDHPSVGRLQLLRLERTDCSQSDGLGRVSATVWGRGGAKESGG